MTQLQELGYQLAATPGTAEYYQQRGITIMSLNKPVDIEKSALQEDNVLKWIHDKRIDLVINIPEGTRQSDEISAGYLMRRAAVDFGTALLTNIKCAALFCDALYRKKKLPCKSIEEYVGVPTVGYH